MKLRLNRKNTKLFLERTRFKSPNSNSQIGITVEKRIVFYEGF